MKLRGALLGAGNIALNGHAPQWTGEPTLAADVEIVAVADLSAANLAAAVRVFPQARSYAHADELLANEALDFCDVCTPPFTHRTIVEAAAARGVHVLCEKPIALTLADAQAIARAVRAEGVVFVPCHQYHYSPQWQAVTRLLPRIGRVHLVEYEVHRTGANPGNPNWSPAWRTNRALAGGGILFDHGAHIFYQLRSVLGEPAAVQGTVRTLRHAEYGVEDSAFVVLDYGDRLAEVRLTWAAQSRAIRFHFVGADGELTGDDERVLVRAATTEEVSFADGMSKNSSHSEWYAPLMRGFVDRVRRGDPGTEPLEEALYVARVISRAYESSEQGRALPLAEAPPAPPVDRALSAMSAVMSNVVEQPGNGAEPPPVKTARRTPWVIRAAGLGVLAVAAGWVLHNVAWQAVVEDMSGANPFWIALACAVYLASVYAMAGRWRAVLRPLAPLVRQTSACQAMVVGFATSIVVPARAGELARAEWLGRRTGLPSATILGSIVLDHLVNASGLFTAIALLPIFLSFPRWLNSGIAVALGIFVAALGAVFVVRPKPGKPSLGGTFVPRGRVVAAVGGFLARARLGLTAVSDRGALARSYATALVAWALEILVVFATLRAFDIQVPFGVSVLVLVAVNVAMALPFVPPANLGMVEVGAMLALLEYGVSKERALAFAVVYHLLQILPIGIGGLVLASRSLLRPVPVPQATRP
ncbi:MAG TPA: lysylphosphatidylglycerol synthase domain-containing protein [Vicinamibacteria bacterium]|nr:lysylphosphatidylglycerol synthase domain-containing protein [Vicinamibacteria bacterium]